jgi:ComEC/Rec2-related protein
MQSNQSFKLVSAWGGSLINWVQFLIRFLTQFKLAVFVNGDKWIGAERSQLLFSLLFGAEQQLANDQRRIFKVIGMLHVLSASGLNVRIVRVTVEQVLQRFKYLSQKIKTILIGLSVLTFFYLSNFGLSLLRACLAAWLALLIGGIFYRQISSLRIFVYVCLLMIVFDKTVVDSISWQMSIAATGSIIWLLPLFQKKLFVYWQPFQDLNSQNSHFTRVIFGLFSYFVQNIHLYLAAQVGILPIVLLTWGEFNPWGLVANACLSGLMPIFIWVALAWFGVCLLYAWLPADLIACLGLLFSLPVVSLLHVLQFLAQIGSNYIWYVPRLKPIFVWIWYGSWFLVGYLWRKKNQKKLINELKIEF